MAQPFDYADMTRRQIEAMTRQREKDIRSLLIVRDAANRMLTDLQDGKEADPADSIKLLEAFGEYYSGYPALDGVADVIDEIMEENRLPTAEEIACSRHDDNRKIALEMGQ